MSYNLNFYPNDTNNGFNSNGFGNTYNPYIALSDYNNNLNFQKTQQETQNRLQQLQNIIGTPQQQFNNQQNNTQQNIQPYYLFCGNKNDWDEFLMLNYGITEDSIFNDYKLFLQAKQELQSEQGQNKINIMKDKIKNKNTDKRFINVDSTIKSNIKPEFNNINRDYNEYNLDNSVRPNNGILEQDKIKSKNGNKQK